MRRLSQLCDGLEPEKRDLLSYERSSTGAIADALDEITTARTASESLAGSHGTFSVQQLQKETHGRLQGLEDALSDVKTLLVQSRGASAVSDGASVQPATVRAGLPAIGGSLVCTRAMRLKG